MLDLIEMEKSTKPVTADSVEFIELTDTEMETTTGGGDGVARDLVIRMRDYKQGNESSQDLQSWFDSLSPGKQDQVRNVWQQVKDGYRG